MIKIKLWEKLIEIRNVSRWLAVFSYTAAHDVMEVNQLDYDTCKIANALATYDNGETVIHLSDAKTRYFVCGRMGHCQQGLKLQVQILAQSNNGTSNDQNQSPGGSPPSTSPPPPPPPPQDDEQPPADEPVPCDCSRAEERHGVVPLITLVIVLAFARTPFFIAFPHLRFHLMRWACCSSCFCFYLSCVSAFTSRYCSLCIYDECDDSGYFRYWIMSLLARFRHAMYI